MISTSSWARCCLSLWSEFPATWPNTVWRRITNFIPHKSSWWDFRFFVCIIRLQGPDCRSQLSLCEYPNLNNFREHKSRRFLLNQFTKPGDQGWCQPMRQPVQGLLMKQVSVGSKTDNRTRGEFARALVLDDLALSKREVLQLWQPFQVELQVWHKNPTFILLRDCELLSVFWDENLQKHNCLCQCWVVLQIFKEQSNVLVHFKSLRKNNGADCYLSPPQNPNIGNERLGADFYFPLPQNPRPLKKKYCDDCSQLFRIQKVL